MVVKFTNVKEEVNYGIMVNSDPGGMIEVLWNPFDTLLQRLEQGQRVNDFVRAGLSRRQTWIRVVDIIDNGSKTELLPITTPVQWTDSELAALQRRMIAEVQPVSA